VLNREATNTNVIVFVLTITEGQQVIGKKNYLFIGLGIPFSEKIL
jgi:hypothetical protein